MDQDTVARLVSELPEGRVWAQVLLDRRDKGWTWRYGQVTVGQQPGTWPDESWAYASVAFVAEMMDVADLREWLTADSDGWLRLSSFDIALPTVQQTAQMRHLPSFELHDRHRSPHPSFQYVLNAEIGPNQSTPTAGRGEFLIGPDSPSFTDLDSAYRAFFLGSYDVPANASVPSNLLDVRVVDTRAWLGPIHIGATQITVDVRGSDLGGATLEYFSPARRRRIAIDRPVVVTIELPDGLPAINTWLWLTRGTSWRDYRALTPPWASQEQLASAGVEREHVSRDEQAVVEAVVYGGEGPFVEFKGRVPKTGAKTDRAFNTIAAFANGSGGAVVFGVDRDELTVLGLGDGGDPNGERDRIGQMIRARILPTPEVAITPHTVSGKTILFAEVSSGAEPPYGVITDLDRRDNPQFYVRRGASTYPAQPSDLNELFHRVDTAIPAAGPRPPYGYFTGA